MTDEATTSDNSEKKSFKKDKFETKTHNNHK
jgi:hypothetical protein